MAAENRSANTGPLSARDFDALGLEPGPQSSKASERSWNIVTVLMVIGLCLYVLGLLTRIWSVA